MVFDIRQKVARGGAGRFPWLFPSLSVSLYWPLFSLCLLYYVVLTLFPSHPFPCSFRKCAAKWSSCSCGDWICSLKLHWWFMKTEGNGIVREGEKGWHNKQNLNRKCQTKFEIWKCYESCKKYKLKGSETADLQRGKTTDWSVRRAGESSQVKVVSACYREIYSRKIVPEQLKL